MFSFVWWIIGFYWVDAGGQDLGQDSAQLYWFVICGTIQCKISPFFVLYMALCKHLLIASYGYICRLCITFLILDVVFVVICVAVACLIGIAVCFCLPCIIAILYALTDQVAKITCISSSVFFYFLPSIPVNNVSSSDIQSLSCSARIELGNHNYIL